MGGLTYVILNLMMTNFVRAAVEESPEKVLMDNLFANYSPNARPVRDPTRAISVNLTFKTFTVDEINEKLQTMTVKGILQMKWRDEFFTWNKTAHLGMERIVLEQGLVWRPDIVVYNGVGSINAPVQTEKNKVIVDSNGIMTWDAEGTFKVSCPIEMRTFPFDEQKCSINVSNNKYTLREVRPHLLSADNPIGSLIQNGQWDVTSISILNSDGSTGYKYMAYILHLKRRSAFYFMNIVFPSLSLMVLGNCIYLIPPETSDRVAVGTTIVLAYTVFMLQVNENTPGSYHFVPYMTIFLLIAMALSSFAVIISIVVLRLSRVHVPPMKQDFSAKVVPCEFNAILESRQKLIKRVDFIFFTLHFLVFLGLCTSLVVLSML